MTPFLFGRWKLISFSLSLCSFIFYSKICNFSHVNIVIMNRLRCDICGVDNFKQIRCYKTHLKSQTHKAHVDNNMKNNSKCACGNIIYIGKTIKRYVVINKNLLHKNIVTKTKLKQTLRNPCRRCMEDRITTRHECTMDFYPMYMV